MVNQKINQMYVNIPYMDPMGRVNGGKYSHPMKHLGICCFFVSSEASSIIQIQICAYVGAIPQSSKKKTRKLVGSVKKDVAMRESILLHSLYGFDRDI